MIIRTELHILMYDRIDNMLDLRAKRKFFHSELFNTVGGKGAILNYQIIIVFKLLILITTKSLFCKYFVLLLLHPPAKPVMDCAIISPRAIRGSWL